MTDTIHSPISWGTWLSWQISCDTEESRGLLRRTQALTLFVSVPEIKIAWDSWHENRREVEHFESPGKLLFWIADQFIITKNALSRIRALSLNINTDNEDANEAIFLEALNHEAVGMIFGLYGAVGHFFKSELFHHLHDVTDGSGFFMGGPIVDTLSNWEPPISKNDLSEFRSRIDSLIEEVPFLQASSREGVISGTRGFLRGEIKEHFSINPYETQEGVYIDGVLMESIPAIWIPIVRTLTQHNQFGPHGMTQTELLRKSKCPHQTSRITELDKRKDSGKSTKSPWIERLFESNRGRYWLKSGVKWIGAETQ